MTTTDFATDTMTPMKSTAGFVKRARAKLQMTQGEFAERLGLERRTIIRYEKGEPLPPTVYFAIKHAVMDVLLALPHELHAYPGHTDETTLEREWEHNPFVRVWRGAEPEGTEPVRVGGQEATLVVWSPDYDGKGKAWVRFADRRDAIVGGSRVERE